MPFRRFTYLLGGALAVGAFVAVFAVQGGRAGAAPECTGALSIDNDCFAERATSITRWSGSEAALADLDEQRRSNDFVHGICHQLAHVIGRTAGEARGKDAYLQGSDVCASGYYHGVIEAVMTHLGVERSVEEAVSVCAEQRERTPRSYAHYNCVHGMGHGYMAVFDSDVFRSLVGCDALDEPWEQRHCYGGVFMENLTSLANAARPSRHLRAMQPLYPCTAVSAQYKAECYIEQTAYALFVRNDDFGAAFELCHDDADRDFRTVCYEGLGGNAAIKASKYVLTSDAQARTVRALCQQAPDFEAQSHCVIGAVSTIVRDRSGEEAQARAVCDALGSGDLRRVCDRARRDERQMFPASGGAHRH